MKGYWPSMDVESKMSGGDQIGRIKKHGHRNRTDGEVIGSGAMAGHRKLTGDIHLGPTEHGLTRR